jgi:hypothetical protein
MRLSLVRAHRAALDFAGDMLDSALELVRDERVPEIVSVPLVFAA